MLVVTYSCEHNHPWPASRHNNLNTNHQKSTNPSSVSAAAAAATTNLTASVSEEDEEEEREEEQEEEKNMKPIIHPSNQSQEIIEDKFSHLCEGPMIINGSEFEWFSDFESTPCTMLESPILTEDRNIATDNEMAMLFTMREEDESLFADLGELPECSTVFRRGLAQKEAEQRRHSGDETMCLPQICLPS